MSFHLTQMGHRFFEATMPRLVQQLTRLNDLLERLVVAVEKQATTPAPKEDGQ